MIDQSDRQDKVIDDKLQFVHRKFLQSLKNVFFMKVCYTLLFTPRLRVGTYQSSLATRKQFIKPNTMSYMYSTMSSV